MCKYFVNTKVLYNYIVNIETNNNNLIKQLQTTSEGFNVD